MFKNAEEARVALKERLLRGDLIDKTDDQIVQILRAETVQVPQRVRASEVQEALLIDRVLVRMRSVMEAPGSSVALKEAIAMIFATVANREAIINLTDPLILETVNGALADIYRDAPSLITPRVKQRLEGLMFKAVPVWPVEFDRINLIDARRK